MSRLVRLLAWGIVVVASSLAVVGAAFSGPPTAPARVLDGTRSGIDVDASSSSLHYAANWSPSTDETGQPVKYELCLRKRTERCTDEHWASAGSADSRIDSGTAQMTAGDLLLSCIRARDVEGNYSDEVCSDGFRVVPAASEITSVMADRAEAGLPADRETVERQAREGAYGDTWASVEGPPLAPGEKPDFTSLEYQTWILDHPAALTALVARGITPEVPSGSNTLEVVAAKKDCSPRDHLREALGAHLVDTAPSHVSAIVFRRPTDKQVQTLLRRHVLSDPTYQAIDVETIKHVRRGVAYSCLDAMARWLARPEVRRHLATNGFEYLSATLMPSTVRINSDSVESLPGASDVIVVRPPIRGSSMPA